MSKKPSKQQIQEILARKKGAKNPAAKDSMAQQSDSGSEDLQQYNINVESYEEASDNEDLEDYKVDGYHPTQLSESFSNGRYVVVQKLGWGHFSTVWLVQDKKKNSHFALKIQKSKKSYSESAIDELELLRDLNSHSEDVKWLQFVKEFNEKVLDGSWINKDKMIYQSKKKQKVPRKKKGQDSDEESKKEEIPFVAQNYEAVLDPSMLFQHDPQETYCVRLIDNFPHFGVHGKHYCSVFDIMGPTLLDLISHFDHYDKQIGLWLVKIITRQILISLVYMHDVCSMIHTDLKPENIMIQLKKESLGEFIEDLKKYKKRPTSMKFLAIQQQKNSGKNKKKYLKKKNKKKAGKEAAEPNIEAVNETKEIKEIKESKESKEIKVTKETNEKQEEIKESNQSKEANESKETNGIKTTMQTEYTQLLKEEQASLTKVAEPEGKKRDHKEKSSGRNRTKPDIKKEFIADDDKDEDFSDVDSGEDLGPDSQSRSKSGSRSGSGSRSCSSSSKASSVDEETLYTLKWKEHIIIKLERELQIKIVDFGNACWTHKKFTDNIQTREYRAPEVILGSDYQANTDIWSVACIVFELITNDYLFKPKKGKGYGKSDDHLALMIETLGKVNKTFAMSGNKSREFFNKNAQLINIKDLRAMPINEILVDDFQFKEQEALLIEDFLLPMLEYEPKKRISAREALRHPWLWSF